MIWPDRVELAQWLNDVVFPAANIQVGADQALRIGALIEALADASDNAAFMLHADRRPPEEVLDYLRHYSLRRESELQRTLRFVSDPQFRTYVFNYRGGSRLLKHAGEVVGLREAFRWVSTEAVTPSAIMAGCYH